MRFLKIKFLFLTVWAVLLSAVMLQAQPLLNDGHTEVTLRLIGHQVLLHAGDSTSRVLPVQKVGDTYQLDFESPFGLEPGELVQLVDSLVNHGRIAQAYRLEVEACETREVVYSFEMGQSEKVDIVPCRGRILPVAYYSMRFTILEYPMKEPPADPSASKRTATQSSVNLPAISATLLLIITALWFYFRKRREESTLAHNVVALGAYGFDTLNMELLNHGKKTELTAKENDLLLLLYERSNTTVEREVILNKVWGDEGDYVGRTLEVFISKLRKKLEADPGLKIVNVRGVGYKLVVNG